MTLVKAIEELLARQAGAKRKLKGDWKKWSALCRFLRKNQTLQFVR